MESKILLKNIFQIIYSKKKKTNYIFEYKNYILNKIIQKKIYFKYSKKGGGVGRTHGGPGRMCLLKVYGPFAL